MPQAYGGQTVTDSAQILPGVIVDSDINASAAIADTKLAQIATASKVSGAALTLLANIPAGAGLIPAANIPPAVTTNRSGLSTRNAGTGSGAQTIAHGLGAAPAQIRFTVKKVGTDADGFCHGVFDGGGQRCLVGWNNSSASFLTTSSSYGIALSEIGGGYIYLGGVVTVNATNIVITWEVVTGGGSSDFDFLWEATV